MKIAEGFVLRQMLNEYIVTGEGGAQVNFNKLVSLNPTAAFLWKSVEGKEFTPEDLVNLLLDEYEVDRGTATADVEKLLAKWAEIGLISE